MVGIPSIPSYALPESSDLPGNIARWVVDPRRAVLLIHDMQHFFLRPQDVCPSTHFPAFAPYLS